MSHDKNERRWSYRIQYTSIDTSLFDNIKVISSLLTILDDILDYIRFELFATNLQISNNIIRFVYCFYCFPSLHSLLFGRRSVCVRQMRLWSSSSADVHFADNEICDLTYSGSSKSKHYKDSFITFICTQHTIKMNQNVDKWATKKLFITFLHTFLMLTTEYQMVGPFVQIYTIIQSLSCAFIFYAKNLSFISAKNFTHSKMLKSNHTRNCKLE